MSQAIAAVLLAAWAVVMIAWVLPRERRASAAFDRLLKAVADVVNPEGKAGLQ